MYILLDNCSSFVFGCIITIIFLEIFSRVSETINKFYKYCSQKVELKNIKYVRMFDYDYK